MEVKICVGSSCHLKGSAEIVELLQKEISARKLEDKIELAGNFCLGSCNRIGVTIQVDDEVYTGITTESFKGFFEDKILTRV